MYFIICFLTLMIWAKKAMKILTYWETKMLLFCHHTKSHQGCFVASVGIWGLCLLDLSHSLRIIWRGSSMMVCLTCFDSVSQLFFHFNAVFWFYGNRDINLQSEPLDSACVSKPLEWYGSEFVIFPFFQSSIDSIWSPGS